MTDSGKPSSRVTRARVLVVDDDATVARCIQRVLTRDHDVVVETDRGRAVMRLERGERYDVVVTDLAMAGMSGVELYTAIRRIDPLQADNVLFLTDAASTQPGRALLQSLSNPRLAKPIVPSELRRSIAQMTSGGEPRPSVRIEPEVLETLAKRFDLSALDTDPSPVAAVDVRGPIVWVNAAWWCFGTENGAHSGSIGPGQNYFRAVRGDLHAWFSSVAARCVTSGEVFESDYECSSDATERHFRMRILPVRDVGLLISHTLRFERPHSVGAQPEVTRYARNGVIVMCSNCRHVRRVDGSTWDWVPSWLAQPPSPVSHGLCRLCLDFYYER